MLEDIKLKRIVFLDIETVPNTSSFDDVSPKLQELWEKKSKYFRKDEQTAADVYQRAGIYAEFGKIVCISTGVLTGHSPDFGFKLKSFASINENELLLEFAKMIGELEKKDLIYLCAHNGKEFDFPYIARRMLINGINLPSALDNAGKKPWEVHHLDTLEMWKFGDYKHYTSLELLTEIFGIPSPKTEIDGSLVASVFYEEKDLEKIVRYCQDDVLAIAQLMLRFKNLPLIELDKIEVKG